MIADVFNGYSQFPGGAASIIFVLASSKICIKRLLNIFISTKCTILYKIRQIKNPCFGLVWFYVVEVLLENS